MAAIIHQVDYNKHIVQHRSRHRTVLDPTGRPVVPRHRQSPYHLSPLSQRHHHKVYNILWSANRYVNRITNRVKQHESCNELCGCKSVFYSCYYFRFLVNQHPFFLVRHWSLRLRLYGSSFLIVFKIYQFLFLIHLILLFFSLCSSLQPSMWQFSI